MSLETDRIEDDVNTSRHRLNDTLQAMGDKLSPGQILDEALGLAQGQAGQFAGNLGRQVRDNPMPTLLIAAGIGLLLLNKGRDQSSRGDGQALPTSDFFDEADMERRFDESDEAYEARLHELHSTRLNLTQRVGETMDAFKQRVADTADGVKQASASMRDRMKAKTSHAIHSVAAGAQNIGAKATHLKDEAADFYDQNPLVSGVIGLALGALMGSALPLSDTERDTLEGVADRAAKTTADVAEKAAQKLQQRAQPMH